MDSPEEAYAYLLELKGILQVAGVSGCNLEEGNVRCDVNCSVRPVGQEALGTKTEIKNLNTFKGVQSAVTYEIKRQIEVLESGGTINQETRRWDVGNGVTVAMRSKEYAHDYRYFPEPDLMPIVIAPERIEEWRKQLPELPLHRRERFLRQYGLPEYDAGVLVADRAIADFFEAAAAGCANVKAVSNWMMTEMLKLLGETGRSIADVPIRPEALAALIGLIDGKTINMPTAKQVFAVMFAEGGMPDDIVAGRGLAQVSDSGAIGQFVDQAMAENPKSVDDYRQGKKAAAKFLVGQVMRLSKGKADPQVVSGLLESKLGG